MNEKPEIIQKIEQLREQYGSTVKIPSPEPTWWQRFNAWIDPLYALRLGNGYLWIEDHDSDGYYNVQWATGRTTHSGYKSSFAVDFDKKTGKRYTGHYLTGAWRTAVTMWAVRDEASADDYYRKIVALINKCLEKKDA